MTRILVAFDFDDASPFVAYAQLRALLRPLPAEQPWETTDEWYDGDGERVPQAVIDAACEAYEEPEAPELSATDKISVGLFHLEWLRFLAGRASQGVWRAFRQECESKAQAAEHVAQVVTNSSTSELHAVWLQGTGAMICTTLNGPTSEANAQYIAALTPSIMMPMIDLCLSAVDRVILRPLAAWDHADGAVLWWKLPIEEPPYCGTPGDSDWPGYHTHWTPLSVPAEVG